MSFFTKARTVGVALLLSLAASLAPALAGTENYEFRMVQSAPLTVRDEIVSVELVNKASGARVADAVIFATRIDMAPDNMANMIMPIEQLSSIEPGIYRFKTQLVMAGNWRLSLGAKVQDETGSIENKLIFKVAP